MKAENYPGETMLSRTARLFLVLFYRILKFFVAFENAEILEKIETPVIFAFNHNNYFETLAVPVCLMKRLRGKKISFLIDWMFGRIPLLKELLMMIDPVFVYNKRSRLSWIKPGRESRTGSAYDHCVEKIKSGLHIGIFPEGTRNSSPVKMKKGKKGIGYLVLKSGAPVLPVGIRFRSTDRRSRIPSIGLIKLTIGEPVVFKHEISLYETALSRDGSGDSTGLVNRLAAVITHCIMEKIAVLCGKSYLFPAPL